jgi:cellulose biosynthesis protein BcsQ
MKKILAVYDSDVIYVTRFMEYFKNLKEYDFDLCAFTKKEYLEDYLKQHIVDILLYGKTMEIKDLPSDSVKYLCQLREDRVTDLEQSGVYKYQSAPLLMEELLSGYARNVESIRNNLNGNTKIITIFSLVPKVEAYVYAGAVAIQYSRQKKTLFIPFDLLPISILSFFDSSKQALSEFVYYLKEDQNIIQKLKSLLSYNANLAYLSGIQHAFDLLTLGKEDIHRLVSEIKKNIDFETVVFYQCFYNDMAVELLRLSDRVILPVNESVYEQELMKEWEEQMERIDIVMTEDKYLKHLLNPNLLNQNKYQTQQELSESPVWKEAAKHLNHE